MFLPRNCFAAVALVLAACGPGRAGGPAQAAAQLPDPATDAARPAHSPAAPEVAVFAGGCFWGVEAVFESLEGVRQATAGYAGARPQRLPVRYEDVATGRTGFAESVRVEYDPAKISYGQLLKVFFSVAHDPTQLDRQGPDVGTQYRSAIFTTSDAQRRIAQAYIARLGAAKAYARPIVTRVQPLARFHQAEAHHQDYMRRHPGQAYIVLHDRPKLEKLKTLFPQLLKDG